MIGVTPIEVKSSALSDEIYQCNKDSKGSFDFIVINKNAVVGLLVDLHIISGKKALFVVHQGTNDKLDVVSDMQAGKKAIPAFGGRARRGFYNHSRKTWRAVRNHIRKTMPDVVIFTGHSLGGSSCSIQAALCMASFERLQNTLHCITFGSPRTFDPDASCIFNDLFQGRTTRFVAPSDPVPRVPTMALFRHCRGRYLLSGSSSMRDEITGTIRAVWNNFFNLTKGIFSAGKHHRMSDYHNMVRMQPMVDKESVTSPTDGYKVY